MVLRFFFPATFVLNCRRLEKAKNSAGGMLSTCFKIGLATAEFCKNRSNLSNQFAATANRHFEFQKSRQLSKSFGGRALFDDVSLQVNRGDRSHFSPDPSTVRSFVFKFLPYGSDNYFSSAETAFHIGNVELILGMVSEEFVELAFDRKAPLEKSAR